MGDVTKQRTGRGWGLIVTKPLVIIGTILLAVATTVVVQVTTDWLPIRPDLRHAGGQLQTPLLELGFINEKGIVPMHITIRAMLRNHGLLRGRVERVELVPVGMEPYPDNVRTIYVDKTEIGWRQVKEIRVEVSALTHISRMPVPGDKMLFRAFFYDPDGREMYHQEIQINGVAPPPNWKDLLPKRR